MGFSRSQRGWRGGDSERHDQTRRGDRPQSSVSVAAGRRTTPETIVPINYPDLQRAVPLARGGPERCRRRAAGGRRSSRRWTGERHRLPPRWRHSCRRRHPRHGDTGSATRRHWQDDRVIGPVGHWRLAIAVFYRPRTTLPVGDVTAAAAGGGAGPASCLTPRPVTSCRVGSRVYVRVIFRHQ